VKKGMDQGKKPELVGGGLLASLEDGFGIRKSQLKA